MGVVRTVKKAGDGTNYPKKGDTIVMSYAGRLENGKQFDSNQHFECKIGVGNLIKGWDVGVVEMSLGEEATLEITPDFGYGSGGFGQIIPPNSKLIFEVKLLKIK